MRKITIIGTGYVGLVTGAGLADFGNDVICVDINHDRIRNLNNGIIPFFEPGLEELIKRNVHSKRLVFQTNIKKAVIASEVVMIAVWTPMSRDGSANLSAIKEVTKTISKNLNRYKVICLKSTVPVGTSRMVKNDLLKFRVGHEFDVVSNPEFLREGSAVNDFLIPNRVVIGTDSERAVKIMKDIYRPLFINETPIIITEPQTSEIIKYASNAFLAVKISFINEIADLCDKVNADVHVVARAMGLDGRIGSKFLHPSPGFGGSCFPKDTKALAYVGRKNGLRLGIVEAASKTNEEHKKRIYNKIKTLLKSEVRGKKIAILGLSFKANTDDIRESPAIYFIQRLKREGAIISAYDPAATENMKKLFSNIRYCISTNDAVKDADLVIILTEWHEFRGMDLEEISKLVRRKIILDTRNVLNISDLKRLNFKYRNVGRSSI